MFRAVGGLVSAVEDLEQQSQPATTSRVVFVNLLNSPREHKLTREQFSQKLDVDLAELIGIDNDESYKPLANCNQDRSLSPRAGIKVFILSGLARAPDRQFQEAALRFAARSQPVKALSSEEPHALPTKAL